MSVTHTSGPLAGFEEDTLTFLGRSRRVFMLGTGPAVVVMAEIPGITPEVIGFARRVADRGMTVVLPHLFGEPGRAMSTGYALQSIAPACVSREFTAWAKNRTSPVIAWLRDLAKWSHERCGGPGVGAIGMCFTGGFALGMMVDDRLIAPALSQPSLPLPLTKAHKANLGVSPADLARIKQRAADDGVCVLGMRFTGDKMAPGDRFDTLRAELGDNFIGIEIDSSPGNPWGHKPAAHSVVTSDLVDEPGQPTQEALHRVLDFFAGRLLATP